MGKKRPSHGCGSTGSGSTRADAPSMAAAESIECRRDPQVEVLPEKSRGSPHGRHGPFFHRCFFVSYVTIITLQYSRVFMTVMYIEVEVECGEWRY
jgi:hypothetical protein